MIQIEQADRVFVLTGAGISAESGLPTFRGSNGLWRGQRVEDVASPLAWERDARMVWTFYSERRRKHRTVEPNPGHHALVELERALGERFFLCTQNVDRLHQQAGSARLVHMHGKLFQSRCERECARPPFDDDWTLEGDAELPRCPCGGRIRPHICWFGETPFELERIFAELARSTVFLAVGTSGVVEPAASFVRFARRQGGRVRTFYVGPEQPANAESFDEAFLGPSGELLPKLFAEALRNA
ncbi:MAG: NAD-dependent deacylase [Acidobacteriota bacterium]|nr:NAD-dependent deacylase [Acidobacteriota bacterium]